MDRAIYSNCCPFPSIIKDSIDCKDGEEQLEGELPIITEQYFPLSCKVEMVCGWSPSLLSQDRIGTTTTQPAVGLGYLTPDDEGVISLKDSS